MKAKSNLAFWNKEGTTYVVTKGQELTKEELAIYSKAYPNKVPKKEVKKD